MSWLLLCHPVPFLCCSAAVEALEVLEARYAAFASSAHFKGSSWSQDVVALDMVLSVLFTACTRVSERASYQLCQAAAALSLLLQPILTRCVLHTLQCQMRHIVALLPEALGADQPLSEEAVVRHFQQSEEGRAWSFPNLTQARGLPGCDEGVESRFAALHTHCVRPVFFTTCRLSSLGPRSTRSRLCGLRF